VLVLMLKELKLLNGHMDRQTATTYTTLCTCVQRESLGNYKKLSCRRKSPPYASVRQVAMISPKTWLGSAQLSANGPSLVSPLGLYEYSTQQHLNADIRQLSTLPSLPSLRMNILHFPLRIFPYALRITEFRIPPITRMSLCPIVATSTFLKQSIATSYRTVNINSAWLL